MVILMSDVNDLKRAYCVAHKKCYCLKCDKYFSPLGVARHRAMHRDKGENCSIIFSDGRREDYTYEEKDNDE